MDVDGVDNQLVIASRFVDGYSSSADHMGAVFRGFCQVALLRFEKDGLYLGLLVLEGEVEVTGIGSVQVRKLPRDTDKGKTVFEQAADGAVELGNGQCLAVIHGAERCSVEVVGEGKEWFAVAGAWLFAWKS